MTDQEMQMLKELFQAAGSVGSQGFEAMVRYTYASGLAWLIGGCFLFVCCLLAIVICFAKGDKWDGEGVAAVFLGACIFGIVSIFMVVSNIVDVTEPEGTTVRELIRMATSG